jgi:transposase InsO family protein
MMVDLGTEFMSRALEDWAYHRGVQLDFIRPGKPVENAFIDAFNGCLRDECLNVHQFTTIADAQEKVRSTGGENSRASKARFVGATRHRPLMLDEQMFRDTCSSDSRQPARCLE